MQCLTGDRPTAIVLGSGLTALATIRCLARGGVTVHCAARGADRLATFSNLCRTVDRPEDRGDGTDSTRWLIDLSAALTRRPVVIPTSDEDALWLARHSEVLRRHCDFSSTSLTQMQAIVSKDGLYAAAVRGSLPVVPSIVEPTLEEATTWSLHHAGPYLLKPFYGGIASCALPGKNLLLNGRDELLGYIAREGTRALIIQRKLDGGDGRILDCYGLCDARGTPVTLASHRRLRQCPPHVGSTCFGEIPMQGDEALEARLFDYTRRLLRQLNYQGIFGIEWLHEPSTGELYVIDFNARPFSSIGHLRDCGLNLPLLAYRDLVGEKIPAATSMPKLTHKYWMDVLGDAYTVRSRTNLGWVGWLRSLLSCRSFAVWDQSDPGPWLHMTSDFLRQQLRKRVWMRWQRRFRAFPARGQ